VAATRPSQEEGPEEASGVDQDAVDEMFKKTMAAMDGPSTGGRRRRRGRRDSGPSAHERREEERARIRQEEATTVRVNEFLTVAEIAELIDITPSQIISSAFKNLGLMVTINQRLDFDQIELLLDEFGFRRSARRSTARRRRRSSRTSRRISARGRRWSPSWVTWTTARPRSSTTSARRT
jgi:translation initiation factor IF-2